MSEPRFDQLGRALQRHGVAARHARRAALEMSDHYHQLRLAALARGEPPAQAARAAHEALGEDAVLIERYAGRRELRGALYRWPAVYALAPLASFAVLSVAIMALLVFMLNGLQLIVRHLTVPVAMAMAVNALFVVALQWVLPVLVGAGFARLASRRPVALPWLIASVLLMCLTARLMNSGLMLPIPGQRGSATLGIGIRLRALPLQLTGTLITAALALAPYFIVRSRADRRGRLPS
jgi:hypothetical protein